MVNTYEALPSVDQLSSFGSAPPTLIKTTPVITVPKPMVETVKLKLSPIESDEKAPNADEDEKKKKQVVKAIFTFAKNVRNAQLVLSPPHLFQQTSTEYLHQIAERTNTTCDLVDRVSNERADECRQRMKPVDRII
jgi:hypothetical protein